MMYRFWFHSAAITGLFSLAQSRQLQDWPVNAVCGDCWCVPEGGTEAGDCPTDSTGIWSTFPDSYPELFLTFEETSTPIVLQAEDGASQSCFPFANSIDTASLNYEASNFPACTLSTQGSSSADAVCAYKYSSPPADATNCPNRQYELVTYDSAQEAASDAAMMVHSGACGVCSNAQDLAVRMSTITTLQTQTITCATQFAFGGTFERLIECYETLGFTNQCATLWAHFSASNAELCAGSCAGQTSTLFGDPPLCELGPCLSCSESFQADFDDLAGLDKSPYNAGFNVDIAYPCSLFTRIDTFDPCFGGEVVETISPAPTSTPAPTGMPVPTAAPAATESPTRDGSGSTGMGSHLEHLTVLLALLWIVSL